MKCEHHWPVSGSFGVILGVTRCSKCDEVATSKHFAPVRNIQEEANESTPTEAK